MSTDAETHRADTGESARSSEPTLQRLGKYQIEKMLGKGGMGAVYLARDTDLRRTVAIKVLPQDKAANPVLVRRFKAEAQAAAQLRHDNIVAVYDSDEADGHLFIAMEYVEGQDLHEMIQRRGTIPVKRSIEIIKQVAAALQHAHEHKIVHRDIKPSNLLIRRDGVVKLTDLGLARSVDDTIETGITRAGTTVGTVDYMSPEQARNSKAADIRSDIYSLGCTWFQMLTGHAPFPEGSMTNKLQAHAIKPIPDPQTENPNVSEGLVAVLNRMMAKKPEDRYQTPAELLADLASSTLTRAAFSQEILNAIDESAADIPVGPARQERGVRGEVSPAVTSPSPPAGGPAANKGAGKNRMPAPAASERAVTDSGPNPKVPSARKGQASLPPPQRQRSLERTEERPVSPWAERIKIFAVIGVVVAGVGGLAWLAAGFGSAFDSPVVIAPEEGGEEAVAPETDAPAVAAVSGGTTGPLADTSTSVAPVYSPGGAATGEVAGTPSNLGGMPSGKNSNSSPTQASAAAQINAGLLSAIKPVEIQQLPTISKTPPSGLTRFVVAFGAENGERQFANLNDALTKLPPEGAIIQLRGSGPFALSRSAPLNVKQLFLQGDPEAISLVVVGKGVDGLLGRLDVSGDLHLDHVHFAIDTDSQTPPDSSSLVNVRGANATIIDSSFSALGTASILPKAVTIQGTLTPQRLFCQRTTIRGSFETALLLQTSATDVVLDESLVALENGTVARFQGASGLVADDGPSRWFRCFSSTLMTRGQLIDLAAESPFSEAPRTSLLFKEVVGTTASLAQGILLNATDWNQQPLKDRWTWESVGSSFLGFERLLELGPKSSFRIDNVGSWRQFWQKPVASQEFLAEVWPRDLVEKTIIAPAVFDRQQLPPTALIPNANGELAGVNPDLLQTAEALFPARLSAMASRPLPVPLIGWSSQPPLRVELRKQDLGGVIAKNDWPDGTVIEAVGFGLCTTTPIVFRDKKLKIIFQQLEGGPLRIASKDGSQSASGLFDVTNGSLEIEGLRTQVNDLRPKMPAWIVAARQSHVAIKSSELRGPDLAGEPYQGLIHLQDDPQIPRKSSVIVQDSVLISAGTLIHAQSTTGTLFVRNSLLATDGNALEIQLVDKDGAIPFVTDLLKSTISARNAAIAVLPASLNEPAKSPARIYADGCAFVPPGPWKLSSLDEPAIIRCATAVLDLKQVTWWGRENGFSPTFRGWLISKGGVRTRTVANKAEWEELWGEGHDRRLLTEKDGTILSGTFPARADLLAPEQFTIQPASRGATWVEGQPVGANLKILKEAGPRMAAKIEPPPPAKAAPKTPPRTPKTNKRPGF